MNREFLLKISYSYYFIIYYNFWKYRKLNITLEVGLEPCNYLRGFIQLILKKQLQTKIKDIQSSKKGLY